MPNAEDIREIYISTCQMTCHVVSDDIENENCRGKFCPTYVTDLLDGVIHDKTTRYHVSTDTKEVNEFCAQWMVELVKELGWEHRIYLNLKTCRCAASRSCKHM